MLSWFDVSMIAQERRADHLREAERDRLLAHLGAQRDGSLWAKLKKRLTKRASPPRKRPAAAAPRPCPGESEVLAI